MICGNRDIRFKAQKACGNCSLYNEGESYRLRDLIPKGQCYELLHSLLPYLTTFENKGWFKWERTRDRVIVCCPAVEANVCVELRKLTSEKPHNFEYTILEVRGACRYYKPGMTWQINHGDFGSLCRNLYNVVFPYIKTGHEGVTLTCGRDGGESRFELTSNESL